MCPPCPPRDQLTAYILGKLAEDQASELEQHLESCSSCDAAFQKMEGYSDTMIAALRQKELGQQAVDGLHPSASSANGKNEIHSSTGDEDPHSIETVGKAAESDAAIPQQIGRYRVVRLVGTGGFGQVYLARDEELKRDVAVKVPHKRLVAHPEEAKAYRAEAQILASLDHPNIVPAFDVGKTAQYPCYFVSKYIGGTNLAERIKQKHFTCGEAARLIATVAKALRHAHKRGLVHRDVKPSNILLDDDETPYVADFGLALRESEIGSGPHYAGTPAYMSPEQARGEGHRVDGRSDIYSLGAVFYELLTGRRVFPDTWQSELLEMTARHDPKPPRQIDDRIPRELERVCLKRLSKRASDRYTTAKDMAEDLQHFLRGYESADSAAVHVGEPLESSKPIKIVPKGLRSFDANDGDFFLELLPGPRDRDGLPESIRFWKDRIEKTDPDQTFSIGLIYGPSGCGKSSLMEAGLLPRLAEHVVPAYVEATAEETETRLLRVLRKRCPALPEELDLRGTMSALRRGHDRLQGKKLLIVLDQFEQWLHAKKEEDRTELVQSLRQCDGGRVQCVLMVRDDFWMPVSEFMRQLEVSILENQNAAAVSLFGTLHARKVLTAFGQAFGRLPESLSDLSTAEQSFLNEAVNGLAQDGKVICVRLALFAEMMKEKPWSPVNLQAAGGTEGVGTMFLEETFSAKTAPPEHRLHQKAARDVLKSLLPESGTNIKGSMRSHDELLASSGYAARTSDFDDLLRILDAEVRLITPTDPDVASAAEDSSTEVDAGERYYQLTHDYLVPSLRDWLTRKQRETSRGRAEFRLAERSALWNAKPENRYLPKWWEHVNIRLFTKKKTWAGAEQNMMRKSGVFHGIRSAFVALCAALLAWIGFEAYGFLQVRNVLKADAANLLDAVGPLSSWHILARNRLQRVIRRKTEDRDEVERREQLHARIARQSLAADYDPDLLQILYDPQTPFAYVGPICSVLRPHQLQFTDSLWDTLHDSTPGRDGKRFRAGLVLAMYAQNSGRWVPNDYHLLAGKLVAANPVHQPVLWERLRPLAEELGPELEKLFVERTLSDSELQGAANAMAEFFGNDGPRMAALATDATPAQYEILYQHLVKSRDQAVKAKLSGLASQKPAEELSQAERITLGRCCAGAAISLLRLGEPERSFGAFQIGDDLESMTQFIHRSRDRGVKATELVDAFEKATDVHSRFAMLLALGDYSLAEIPEAQSDPLIQRLTESYRNDPSSGIHSATGWLLRQWGFDEAATEVDHTPVPYDATGQREWFVLEIKIPPSEKNGSEPENSTNLSREQRTIFFTFIVFPPDEFTMGSPESEADHEINEVCHRVKLARPIAICDRELTWGQWMAFEGDRRLNFYAQQYKKEPGPDDPAFGVDWFDAVSYCRWLTTQAGMPPSGQCYGDPESLPKDAEGNPKDWPVNLDRHGFRLPTEAEWEYVCRSGTSTACSFGNDVELLGHYAWYQGNSKKWSHAVGEKRPNIRGLFDTYGNLCEWCHDWYEDYDTEIVEDVGGTSEGSDRVLRGGSWLVPATLCRAAYRLWFLPSGRRTDVGFRVAAVPSCEQASERNAGR